MVRRHKPQDPTYALIELMVEKCALNATTQEEVMDFSRMFMNAFLEPSLNDEMNHFLKVAAAQESSQEPADHVEAEDEGELHNSPTASAKRPHRLTS